MKTTRTLPDTATLYDGAQSQLIICNPNDPPADDVYIRFEQPFMDKGLQALLLRRRPWIRLRMHQDDAFSLPQLAFAQPLVRKSVDEFTLGRAWFRCWKNVPAPKRIRVIH